MVGVGVDEQNGDGEGAVQQSIKGAGLSPRVDQHTLPACRTDQDVRVHLPWSDRPHPRNHLHHRFTCVLESVKISMKCSG